jgi:NAD(P)-dependent dehydrogenase (short-subunit alcohol dehydrogenase family)
MVAEFAARGWIVAGCARGGSAIRELARAFPAPHFFHACDVSDDAAVASFAADLVQQAGVPDLVLNNAAIITPNAPVWEVSAADFDRIIDINIKGTMNVMRHFLPPMLKRGSGVMVNFSSGWGRATDADVAPYCATKWAIEGLSRAAAQDTQGKVAVVPLNPGIIDTAMLRSCFGEDAGGYPQPEEWARLAVPFLAGLGPKDNGRPLTAPG